MRDKLGRPERRAVKAYCLRDVKGPDWLRVMPKYRQQLKKWQFIPSIIYILLFLAGGIAIGFNWYYPWLPIAGFLISALAARNLGSRYGNIDGFQIGYEWGKEDGVCRGLGIKETEQEELLQSADDYISEVEWETGDPRHDFCKRLIEVWEKEAGAIDEEGNDDLSHIDEIWRRIAEGLKKEKEE
jgi:hypothetical protein